MNSTAATPITVRVRENAHYMDDRAAYTIGPYASYAEAEAVCRKMVDQFLAGNAKPGIAANELFGLYTTFGEDPSVVGGAAADVHFSAWDYAKRRCGEMCRG